MQFYSFSEFNEDVKKIVSYFKNKQIEAIVTLSRGGMSLAQFIAYRLSVRDVFCIRAISYEENKQLDEVKILDLPNLDGFSNILIVDDIIDSGKTIKKLLDLLKQNYDKNYYIASIYYKKSAIIKPDFFCKIATEWIEFFWERDYYGSG